jgi:hypothetical protein
MCFLSNGKTFDFVTVQLPLGLQCIIGIMLTAATINVPFLLHLPGNKEVGSFELKWDVSNGMIQPSALPILIVLCPINRSIHAS